MKILLYNLSMDNLLIDAINKATENEFNFSLKSASFHEDADFCVIKILYSDGKILGAEKKRELMGIMSNILPQKFKYDIEFIKNFISDEELANEIKIFMKHNFPSVCYKVSEITKNGNCYQSKIIIDTSAYDHAKGMNIAKKAEEYFKAKFSGSDFVFSEDTADVFVEDEEKLMRENYHEEKIDFLAPRKIEVSEVEPVIGEEAETLASYISDKGSLPEYVTFCGSISAIRCGEYERKSSKKAEESSEDDEPKVKRYFRWKLTDFTDTISCFIMSTNATYAKLSELLDGETIIVTGKLAINNYSGEQELSVKSIAKCKLPSTFEEVVVYKPEKPFYEWVKPEKLVTYRQNDLMNFMNEEKVCPHLAGKTFVCYDLETTGLHFENGDKIIELGAVKIENGKITEQFSSFVNPERSIPEAASYKNHIYDSDVVDAPKDFQVLQDFFKFTRGATLIGYNIINFDNVFLRGQGRACHYNFDNPSEDVYDLAQKFVHGVKNYKLTTIAEHLGVTLDNAHRALYDTIATAEVFIKLAENLD